MLLQCYKYLLKAATPFLEIYLQKRERAGKEDSARKNERRGVPTRPRPEGTLIWLHAASVGESISLLVVVEKILQIYPDVEVMVTTGTVTSAKIMASRLPPRAFHQYIPVDHPVWVQKFLDHWKPDFVIWSESEFWPNMLMAVQERHIPAVLLNARMSQKSFIKWHLAKSTIRSILSTFNLCLAQNDAEADRLIRLGAQHAKVSGNLKYSASALPFDAGKLETLRKEAGGRALLLFASTHPGEEEIALATHRILKQAIPDLLTVIVPRHPQRGLDIAALAGGSGCTVSVRSKNETMGKSDIYVADTLGELGLFFRLCKIVVIGGSFADIGGHNPIEPAQLGCIILYGPVMYNFVTINDDFLGRNAAIQVKDIQELQEKLKAVLQSPENFSSCAAAAEDLTKEKAQVVESLMADMRPYLQRAASRYQRQAA